TDDGARREHEIEVRIALDPPGSAADWLALAGSRLARQDRDAAVECLENARWLDRGLDASAIERSIETLENALGLTQAAVKASEFPMLARNAGGDDGTDVRGLRLRALYLEAGKYPETTLTPKFLEQMYSDARAAVGAERLRKKTRWLVWRAVLARTGDEIEAERQREQILADLNQDGLAPLDRTDFVRPRLAERVSGAGGDGELQKSLDGLTARLGKIEDPRLRWTGTSLLARRWAELDDVARATQLAMDAATAARQVAPGLVARSAPVARILGNAAAALIRVGNPEGEKAFRESLAIIGGFSNGDEKGRTMVAVLDALASAQNPRLATPLARLAIPVIREGDVRRASLNLERCAKALAKLDVAPEARALALALAQHPDVVKEPHYLTGAVGALAALSRPGSLQPAERNAIIAAVEKHQKDFEDVNSRLVEGAIALAGEEFAKRISERMRNTAPADIRFAQLTYWACAIQGLAAARAADVGLEDLERAIRLAWQLPSDDERRRCIKRLVGTAASFGRVGPGLMLVRDVITRCEPQSVGPYFKSEVLSACVEAIARLGDRQGAFDVMDRVIKLVERTARESPGDVTFLFDVLGLCVDHAVTVGVAGESAQIIQRVEKIVEEWMDESSARYWTPFYRYKALAKCGRGLARLGQEAPGLAVLSRILGAANPPAGQGQKMMGLDLMDLLKEIVRSLSEIGGKQRLELVDRVLDAFLSEKSVILGESGPELLGLILDEVVSPASRVRAEYARFLGAEERAIRERVANEQVTGGSGGTPPSGPFPVARRA
ncbi:MAG TPA: hypothetical protein VMV18_06045, partial [bacterium]|nr:hypothetical protein [bacterium]